MHGLKAMRFVFGSRVLPTVNASELHADSFLQDLDHSSERSPGQNFITPSLNVWQLALLVFLASQYLSTPVQNTCTHTPFPLPCLEDYFYFLPLTRSPFRTPRRLDICRAAAALPNH